MLKKGLTCMGIIQAQHFFSFPLENQIITFIGHWWWMVEVAFFGREREKVQYFARDSSYSVFTLQ